MNEAMAYTRYSSKSLEKGTGVERQMDSINGYAMVAGYTIISHYHDVQTGKSDWDQREQFQSMLSDMQAKGVSIVIVEHMDRVARELRVQEVLIKALRDRGIRLLTACGEDKTSDDDNDVMKRQFEGIMADQDRRRTVKKLKAGRDRKRALTGRCEGQKPFGWFDAEKPTLSRIQAMRAAGETLEAIAAQLNATSAPTRTGAAWNYGTVANILRRCVSLAQPAAMATAA